MLFEHCIYDSKLLYKNATKIDVLLGGWKVWLGTKIGPESIV
jgi:hypothetical protein